MLQSPVFQLQARRLRSSRESGFTLLEMGMVVGILAILAGMVLVSVDKTRDKAADTVSRATLQTLREAVMGSAAGPGYLSDMKYVPGFSSLNMRVHDLLSSSSYPVYSSYDPVARRGWRGPYLSNARGVQNTTPNRNGTFPAGGDLRTPDDLTFQDRGFFTSSASSPYGLTGDLAAADPWGNPIVIQIPPSSAFSGSTAEAKIFRYARLVSAGPDGTLSTPLDDRLGGMLPDGSSAARGDDLVLFLNRSDVYEAEEP